MAAQARRSGHHVHMAAWRRNALRLFPELHDQIEGGDAFSPYAFFFLLLPFARDAHKRGDQEALRRVYGFAQWCHHQRAGSELPNAVDVAFYEHLFDDWSLREQTVAWLSPTIRTDLWPLWKLRLDEQKTAPLRQLLDGETMNREWQQLRSVVGDD
jgi:hypothetical protein